MKRISCVIIALLIIALRSEAETKQNPFAKISKTLQEQMASQVDGDTFEALVYLKDQMSFEDESLIPSTRPERNIYIYNSLSNHAQTTQADLLSWLSSENLNFKSFYVANVVLVQNASKEQVVALAAREDVRNVVANPVVTGVQYIREDQLASNDQEGIEIGIKTIMADKVWADLKVLGEGIVIAGQDTGVEFEHPAIQKQYRGYGANSVDHDYNWHDAVSEPIGGMSNNPCGYATKEPCDDNGHGTHTIGTIVGDDGKGNQIGVAPKAKWIACRNMDQGAGKPSSYLDCFQFFMAPFPVGGDPFKDGDASKAPHILNNSWGCPESEGCEGGEFKEVVANLHKAGIYTIVSAGNEGPDCETINAGPAHNTANVYSVGAISSSTKNIVFFSSRGPSAFDGGMGPDITAPGYQVRSSIPGGGYASFSGTSMAGPHMVGAAALLWSAKPALVGKVEDSNTLFNKTATAKTTTEKCGNDTSTSVPNNVYGYGIVNVLAAIQAAN